MSSTLPTNANLPPPATKVGGARLPAPYKHHNKQDDALTPQTNVETSLGSRSQEELMKDALGVVDPNPTMTVHDAAEHPKVNASTYNPPQPQNLPHTKHRQNAANTYSLNQPGGAHGVYRH